MDINLSFNQETMDIGMLGRQGENNETRLVIDCQSVLEEHPDAVIGVRMMGRLPGEKYYDLPVTREDGSVYTAKLSTFDMCWDGNKEIQLRAMVGEWEKRSARFHGYVAKSLFDFRPPTGVVSDWLDDLKKALAKADAADEHGPVIKDGLWYVWQDGAYVNTGVKAEGVDGEKGPKGDKGDTGSAGRDGVNGKDGEPGKDGADGVSPVVAVQAITGGHRVTVQDAEGVKTFDVMDGKDGKDGEGGGASVELDTTLSQSGKAADAKAVGDALKNKAGKSELFSGNYNDLTNKPTIPAAYSLPIANASTLGGVKPVAKTSDMTQAVGVDGTGALFTLPGGGSGGESGGSIVVYDQHIVTTEEVDKIEFNLHSVENTELILRIRTGSSTFKMKIGVYFPVIGNNNYNNYVLATAQAAQYDTNVRVRLFGDVATSEERYAFVYWNNILNKMAGPYYDGSEGNRCYLQAGTSGETFPIGTVVDLYEINY